MPSAAIKIPAGIGVSAVVSFVGTYRGCRNNFIRKFLEAKNDELLKANNSALTSDDEAAWINHIDNAATIYALINIFPETVLNIDYSDRYKQIGASYFDNKKYDKAIEVYKLAVSLKPNDSDAYFHLAYSYAELNQNKNAIEAYKKVISLNPNNNSAAFNNIGNLYWHFNQHDQAIESYKQAINLNPDDALAYNNLGNLYSSLRQYENAIEVYKQAVRINPYNAEAHYNLGLKYSIIGQDELVIAQYQTLKKLNKLELADKLIKINPITNSLGMTFVYIDSGSFMMGSPPNELGRDSDETQHSVTLTQGFYMQTTEVTQGQWRALMWNNPSHFKNCGDDCPVDNVSWEDVQEFIAKLNWREFGNLYRLPTEAEWEYAARAGTTTRFSWGNQADCRKANYGVEDSIRECRGKNSGETMPVGQFDANAWGLYDMHGNVWEWCQDWYGDYPTGSVTDPKGPSSGSSRVYRGGGWYDSAVYCRSANRVRRSPGYRFNSLGFRLLRLRP